LLFIVIASAAADAATVVASVSVADIVVAGGLTAALAASLVSVAALVSVVEFGTGGAPTSVGKAEFVTDAGEADSIVGLVTPGEFIIGGAPADPVVDLVSVPVFVTGGAGGSVVDLISFVTTGAAVSVAGLFNATASAVVTASVEALVSMVEVAAAFVFGLTGDGGSTFAETGASVLDSEATGGIAFATSSFSVFAAVGSASADTAPVEVFGFAASASTGFTTGVTGRDSDGAAAGVVVVLIAGAKVARRGSIEEPVVGLDLSGGEI